MQVFELNAEEVSYRKFSHRYSGRLVCWPEGSGLLAVLRFLNLNLRGAFMESEYTDVCFNSSIPISLFGIVCIQL
jgi:hypothetical protein